MGRGRRPGRAPTGGGYPRPGSRARSATCSSTTSRPPGARSRTSGSSRGGSSRWPAPTAGARPWRRSPVSRGSTPLRPSGSRRRPGPSAGSARPRPSRAGAGSRPRSARAARPSGAVLASIYFSPFSPTHFRQSRQRGYAGFANADAPLSASRRRPPSRPHRRWTRPSGGTTGPLS